MQLPTQIGKYRISNVLGRGAMGVVYKGFDPHIHRLVAIKTIHKSLLADAAALDSVAARFRNEAQAVGRLAHPGIVAIYEFGEDDDTAFIAMEYVEGQNLEFALTDEPLLPEPQVLRIMDQLLDALVCAHQHGVWHRDIKPANLILATSGQLKLTDFGIARIEHQGLTQVSSMIGTPGYMAPEQYRGKQVDHRADLFASGVLLYRLLTGHQPFKGDAQTVMYQILHEPATPPSQASPRRLDGHYDGLMHRALAKQADDRFQSAQTFRQALRATVSHPETVYPGASSDPTVLSAHSIWAADAHATHATRVIDLHAFEPTRLATALHPAPLDNATLGRIERALAHYVGPMAKMMVSQAARSCGDVASLASDVARHIGAGPQRDRFISEITAGSLNTPAPAPARSRTAAPRSGPSAAPAPTSAPRSHGGAQASTHGAAHDQALTDADLSHALRVLTRHLGPIAKILLKRASGQAKTRSQLFARLLDAATDGDRAALQKDLLGP